MKKLSTDADLRERLKRLQGKKKVVDLAGEIGIRPNQLSMFLNGWPLSGKVVSFLGYRKVKTIFFERIPPCGKKKKRSPRTR